MTIRKINMEQLRYALNLRDLSNSKDGHHAMQLVMQDILKAQNGIGHQKSLKKLQLNQ